MNPFFDALGWALLHSIWQGALVALLVFISAYRLKSAQKRYWVAFSGLASVLFLTLITLYYCAQKAAIAVLPSASVPPMLPSTFSGIGWTSNAEDPSFWETFYQCLEVNKPYVVSFWLLGFSIALFRLFRSWLLLRKLRTRFCFDGNEYWQARLSALALQIGLTRPVLLLESALAQTPMALGYLKPMIVFPLGLINQLSPAETEAVLAHELAHLSRHDWVFNLIQACIETLFYFHPAVWWMSAIVHRERENACDDTAVALIGNRIAYAKTLVRLQEMAKPAAPAPALALGITGSNTITRLLRPRLLLLERIKRILQQPQPSFNVMEKLTASAVLLILLLAIGWRANADSSVSQAFSQITELPSRIWAAEDSLPKPKSTRRIVSESDEQTVEVEYQNNEMTRLKIDGKEIPAAEFDRYSELTQSLQTPPAAPAPPDAPYPATAPAPPFPPSAPFPATPPSPPVPPSSPRIFWGSEDDRGSGFWSPAAESLRKSFFHVAPTEEGTTTIMGFDADGKQTEIRVKNGEVWIDGKKVARGESFAFPEGQSFGLSENGYFFQNGDAKALLELSANGQRRGFNALDINPLLYSPSAESPTANFFRENRFAESYESIAADMDRMRADMERLRTDKKYSEKEIKKREKEFEKLEKDYKKLMEKNFPEQLGYRGALLQERANLLQQREAVRGPIVGSDAKGMGDYEDASTFWINQLYKDGVISDKKKFSMTLSNKKMVVNGKKLSDVEHRKYLEMFNARGGRLLEKDSSFSITHNED